MNTETPFEKLSEDEQNHLLRKLANLFRPILGEIGGMMVKEHKIIGEPSTKKPGYIGLLFDHPPDKVIVFAEYVDQDISKQMRNQEKKDKKENKHIIDKSKLVDALWETAEKQSSAGNGTFLPTEPFLLRDIKDNDVEHAFYTIYGASARQKDFKIKLWARSLKTKPNANHYAVLYFAFAASDEITATDDMVEALCKFAEHIIRSALVLAVIGDPELHSVVRYLTAKLPQSSFNDNFIHQTLAAIYAYVREVVPITLDDTPKNIQVNWENEDDEVDEVNELKSIHKASCIDVNRRVVGSLKRAKVFSLTITTTAKNNESTKYPAIAKFSTVKEAREEADGLRKMQRYYSCIGKMLPPPLEVYLLTKYDESTSRRTPPLEPTKDWMDTPCISVTPDLEGSILAEKIASLWALPTRRVEKFTGFLGQARTFIREIQRQPFIESGEAGANLSAGTHRPHDLLIEFFEKEFKFPAQKERYTSLLDAFNSNFPFSTWLKLGSIVEAKLVNPHVWLKKMIESPNSIVWQNHHQRSKRFVLKHGDFHAGNLFYTSEGDNLVVLDYDRVGGGLPEEDLACLDASFVSAVFGLSDFDLQSNWEKYALESIALLSWIHPSTIDCHCNNSFARELFETLSILRPGTICPFYAASVVKALVGQLRARCVPWNDQKKKYESVDAATLNKLRARNASAWLYMAMMLSHLVMPDSSDPEDFHPY